MSKDNFKKLVRHIEQTGRYEPIVVRPLPHDSQTTNHDARFQIINGHHRCEALKQLGHETCDCVVWDIDDDQTALLLVTLNRLCGQDILEKKTALLEKLNSKYKTADLAKLLPNTKAQIDRMIELHRDNLKIELAEQDTGSIAFPFVFFLNAEQKEIVEKAIELSSSDERQATSNERQATSKAVRNAQAIALIAEQFICKVKG
jgi:ParB-like chromosome segregation protein Spo0J